MAKWYWLMIGFWATFLPTICGAQEIQDRIVGAIVVFAVGYVGKYLIERSAKSTVDQIIQGLNKTNQDK